MTYIKSGAITFGKSITKGKHKTRIVHIPPALAAILDEYQPKAEAMFPGMSGVTEYLTRLMADNILRDAYKRKYAYFSLLFRSISKSSRAKNNGYSVLAMLN